MTEYIFRLSDETPEIEVDVKAAAIINGVGQDLYDRAKKELGFTGTFEEFLTKFKGDKGDKGKSAYEIAVANGYVGDEAQWLYSLKGRDGSPGRDGLNGESAFEIAGGQAVYASKLEWLASLKGAKGDPGAAGKSATVTIGTVTTGETASVTNTGTETEAVLNFVLPKGEDGHDGVGIAQKLTLSGNTLTLSDGGGSVTLPSQPATNAPAGQANEYEIHGQGMPNGRVVAPVGTTYVDTNATNGAFKWIKRTGADNQGWEVLSGDTGWRNLTIASKLGGSFLKVRRKNDIVMFQFGGLQWGWFGVIRRGGLGYNPQPSDRERNCFILGLNGIPEGFRSESSLIGGIYNDKGTPYGTWYLGGIGDSNMLRFQFTDPVPTDRDIGDIRVSTIMYITNNAWPTRLP
ncbi:hypothetical protein HpSP79_20410 [Helicobacter pylori]